MNCKVAPFQAEHFLQETRIDSVVFDLGRKKINFFPLKI